MEKFKLTTLHYILIGTIIGMIAVFGAFSLYKQRMTPKDVPEIHATEGRMSETQDKCPVCGKPVNPASDFYITLANKKFNFCGTVCLKSFKDEPLRYIRNMGVNIDINITPNDGSGKSYKIITDDGADRSGDQQDSGGKGYQEIPTASDSDSEGGQESASKPTETRQPQDQPPPAPSSGSGDSSGFIDEIPLPDDITKGGGQSKPSNPPAGGGGGIEELMLDGGGSGAPTPPDQQGGGNGGIEELNLDVPSEPPQQTAPPPKPQPQKQGDMVIEEIPLN